ncbi:midkine-B-like isoform X2 [Betta splendens]|nr:midkine-B-like isoform X2 [Betta splendens]
MRAALLLLLLLALIGIERVAGGKNKKERSKPSQSGSECTDWRYGNCVPSNGDCGPGFREGSCDQQTMKMKCKVPCKWRRQLFRGDDGIRHSGAADCRYRFGSWGECDQSTGARTRIGTLRRALNNAECQQTVSLSKPCSKSRRKPGKKRKGKGN